MMAELRKDCPMRHENGNCTVIGGFCTAVNDPICEGLHHAYDSGYRAAALRTQKGQTPCSRCGYRGEHLDAPPCIFCPAHPKGQKRICAGQYMDTLECVLGGRCIGPDCPGFEAIGNEPLTPSTQQEQNICGCTNLECASCTPGPCEHRKQPNAPLTMNELYEQTDPVFCAIKNFPGGGYWCLCQGGYIIPPSGQGFSAKERPDWVFYRHKPEEGTK